MNIEQAIEIIGGKSKLRLGINHPIAVLIAEAKNGDGIIDEDVFLRTLEHCRGEAARNRAINFLRNSVMLVERQKKTGSLQRLLEEKENEHHHFMP